MHAMVISGFGGPDVLHAAELPLPEPGAGEVRVRVAYSSVNPADWKARQGMLSKYITYEFPFILGFDLSGTVDAVGEGVTRFKAGDRVFGTSRQGQGLNGSYAEYTIAAEAMLAPLPSGLSFAEAACLPTAGTTALGGLLDVGGLKDGQSVLINGGAGGVGSIAIQIARHVGARVLATCSAGNADYVRELGADLAIDYRNADVVKAVLGFSREGVDLVLDAVGLGTLLPRATDLVRPGGSFVEIETLISEASPEQVEQAAARGVRLVSNMIAIASLPDQLRRLGQLAGQGAIKAPLAEIIPLAGVAQAHRRIETGHVRGKIALAVCGDS